MNVISIYYQLDGMNSQMILHVNQYVLYDTLHYIAGYVIETCTICTGT